MRGRKRVRQGGDAVLGVTLAGALGACLLYIASPQQPSAAAAESKQDSIVQIIDDHFAPDTMRVAAGMKVKWVNRDDETHTVMSTDSSFTKTPKQLKPKGIWTYRFKKPGTYDYYCSIHPFMKGTIVVQ
jgi:plastocyanin